MKIPDPNYFKEHPYSGTQYFMKSNFPDFYEYLQTTYPGLKLSEQMYRYFYGGPASCPVCGKPTSYKNFNKGYSAFCSVKCSRNSSQTKEKTKKTCLERYGVENPHQAEQVKNKAKKTCLERYDVEAALQNPDFMNKVRQTNLKRYGVEYAGQAEQSKEKSKKTCLERYDVEHSSQSKQMQQKAKQTFLKKYGVEYPMQCAEIRAKSKKTCLERYGAANPMQCEDIKKKLMAKLKDLYGAIGLASDEIKQRAKKTCLERYGVEYPMQCEDIKKNALRAFKTESIQSKDFLLGYTEDGQWICKCPHPECNMCKERTFITPYGIRYDRLKINAEICTNLFPVGSHETSFSNSSQMLFKELDKFFENYTTHYASKDFEHRVGSYSLDYFVEELKLVIEFNGDYWHANPNKYDANWMHPILNKTAAEIWAKDAKRKEYLEKMGYEVVIIWEDEVTG